MGITERESRSKPKVELRQAIDISSMPHHDVLHVTYNDSPNRGELINALNDQVDYVEGSDSQVVDMIIEIASGVKISVGVGELYDKNFREAVGKFMNRPRKGIVTVVGKDGLNKISQMIRNFGGDGFKFQFFASVDEAREFLVTTHKIKSN